MQATDTGFRLVGRMVKKPSGSGQLFSQLYSSLVLEAYKWEPGRHPEEAADVGNHLVAVATLSQ